jgi:AcrR family transcriptional regulator
MDAVAAEAGVGKGTLFRRFGDRAGLAVALLDERERDLQAAVLSGPPPLGPGAPPGSGCARSPRRTWTS